MTQAGMQMPGRRRPWQNLARRAAARVAACCALLLLAGGASAAWPERPVTILVPFPPGGANDVVVRAIQAPLGDALGQPIIIENRAGAGGNIGIGAAAHARADGYSLLMAASGFAVNPSLYDKVPYDPVRDFEPIAEISTFPIIITVRPDLGVSTLGQLIARARQKPGALNYASPGVGTLPHLAMELLKLDRGIDIVHVVYPGGAQAAQAILSHTVEVAAMSISDANPLIVAGLLKGLAVTSRERWPDLPDIPTMEEAGVPAAAAETWQGILAPAGTPKDITERLAAALTEIMQRPAIRANLLHVGFRATGLGSDEFRARILREVPLWKEVISRARIKAQ